MIDGDREAAASTTQTSRSALARRIRLALVAVGLIAALATLYIASPEARQYVGQVLHAVRQRADAALNPPPRRDLQLVAEAATCWQQQDWPKIAETHARLVELEPDNAGAWSRLASARHHFKDYQGAIEANLRAVESPANAATGWYNIACARALLGQTDEAFDALDAAFRNGFRGIDLLSTDADLDPLRDDPRFWIPPAPTQESFTRSDGVTIDYWLVLPRDFDPAATYPVLIGINGSNQGMQMGNFALNSFWGMQAHCAGWIVANPAPVGSDAFYYGDGHLVLDEFLDHIAATYRAEGGKFHIAGYSNGGTSAFNIAGQFPDRFQSVTAFPGYAIPGPAFDRLGALRGMTITMFWGETDKGPARKYSLLTHDRLEELGIDSTIREFAGEPHIPPSLMGEAFMRHMDSLRPASGR
jgi:hypothetical protein